MGGGVGPYNSHLNRETLALKLAFKEPALFVHAGVNLGGEGQKPLKYHSHVFS